MRNYLPFSYVKKFLTKIIENARLIMISSLLFTHANWKQHHLEQHSLLDWSNISPSPLPFAIFDLDIFNKVVGTLQIFQILRRKNWRKKLIRFHFKCNERLYPTDVTTEVFLQAKEMPIKRFLHCLRFIKVGVYFISLWRSIFSLSHNTSLFRLWNKCIKWDTKRAKDVGTTCAFYEFAYYINHVSSLIRRWWKTTCHGISLADWPTLTFSSIQYSHLKGVKLK